MSIWTKPLWGKARAAMPGDDEPARASATNAAYLAAARGTDDVGWFSLVFLGGKLITGIELIVSMAHALDLGAGQPASTTYSQLGLGWLEVNFGGWGWLRAISMIALVIWGVPWFFRFIQTRQIASMTRAELRRWRKSRARTKGRRGMLLVAAMPAAVLGAVAIMSLMLRSWSPLGFAAALGLNYTGLGLVVWGWRSRVGTRIVCAKCDYAMGSWRAAGERCPECGNAWKEPWRARLGERRVRGRVIAMGALVLVVNAVGVMTLMSLALRR